MPKDTLADAFYDELRDMLSAEKQLVKALPKLVKKSSNSDLQQAFENHLKETEKHVERVEQAFEETGKAARAKTCDAMKGLVTETENALKEDADPAVMDAIIIACAQKSEHYEIASYGTLCTWAENLGYDKALKLLKQNMSDEEVADKKLTELAKKVNREALATA